VEDRLQRAFGYRSEQRKRSENQDSFGVFDFDGFTLAIVCDGMGGHVGGAQASSLAVRTVHDNIKDVAASADLSDALRAALERANQAIYEAARKNHRLMGMGTTAVAAILTDDGFVHIAHVGDSRAYLINEGQAVQVTRDHTMVNLFVDAELLTPEDAATHPEAHVLSRSLGVERQVEVEISDPIELADSDVVLLCSDGVHGVVTDWELGSIDWASPEPGIAHIIDIVDAREGDDNATALAVLIGEAPSMGPSPVPDPKAVEAQVSISAPQLPDLGALDDDYESLSDPDSSRTEPSAPSRSDVPLIDPDSGTGLYVEYGTPEVQGTYDEPTPPALPDDHPSYLTEEPEQPQKREETTIGASTEAAPAEQPAPQAESQPLPRKKKKKSSRAKLLIPLAGIAAVGVLSIGVMAMLLQPDPADDIIADIVVDDGKSPRPEPGSMIVEPAEPDPEPVEEAEVFFVAEVPEPPRRLPHRPLRYTQPPPRGAKMFQAVQAARDRKCAESLAAVQEAMGTSPDHAKLYSSAWFCFNETHARTLQVAEVESFEEFAELETYFRGWPEVGEAELEWTTEDKRLPLWYRPALDGIEYRLEAWADSTEDDLMREVMVDLEGEPAIADDFAADLIIEAQAAVALSKAEERTPDIEEAWARRVFVVSRALKGRVGKMLRTHRPELVPTLESLLEESMTRQENGPDVPGGIATAHKVGTGEEDPPIKSIRTGPRPDPLGKEPDLGTDLDGKGKAKIYK
jgi:protein phosphatase